MRTNLKMIMSAVGIAALLTSPVLAKSVPHQHRHAALQSNGHGFVGPFGYGLGEGGPSQPTTSDWSAIRRSWDACDDPRESPRNEI